MNGTTGQMTTKQGEQIIGLLQAILDHVHEYIEYIERRDLELDAREREDDQRRTDKQSESSAFLQQAMAMMQNAQGMIGKTPSPEDELVRLCSVRDQLEAQIEAYQESRSKMEADAIPDGQIAVLDAAFALNGIRPALDSINQKISTLQSEIEDRQRKAEAIAESAGGNE